MCYVPSVFGKYYASNTTNNTINENSYLVVAIGDQLPNTLFQAYPFSSFTTCGNQIFYPQHSPIPPL
jgi:hypothetical protein